MGWFGLGGRTFAGGVHPHDEKVLTQDLPIVRMPDPEHLVLPIVQHLGRPARPVVKKGEWVREGQLMADAQDGISAVVRAPRAGLVQALHAAGTVTGFPGQVIVLKVGSPPLAPDGQPTPEVAPIELPPLELSSATAEDVITRVRDAGIVGQGGAAFPTAIKLAPPPGTALDVLLVNGCECEPYLTRDYRLMLEQPAEVLEGAQIVAHVLGVRRIVVGVEDNKPAAIQALRDAARSQPALIRDCRIEILPLRTKYPQGAEKMLIEAATRRRVAPGQLPMSVGAAIQNVGTVLAVREAVVVGHVQTDAVLTVSGRGVRRPANLRVPVGATVADVLEYCGGLDERTVRIVVGGPMMGVAQHDLSAPVVKACSGILALTPDEVGPAAEPGPCLRCGRCGDACPIHLVPSRLSRLSELGRVEEARDQGIEVCMECGTCAFVCPSHLPLVQWLRLGKQQARKLGRHAS